VMFAKGFTCESCHGSLSQVASSTRRPWLDEPSCNASNCHTDKYGVEPGKLYRNSKGHGGLYCSACHGSPHAIVPTVVDRDNAQNIALQGTAGALSKCEVCHGAVPSGPGPHGIPGVGVKEDAGVRPGVLAPPRNVPNPFNASTVIEYTLSVPGMTALNVFDLSGRRVCTLLSRMMSAGAHSLRWDGADNSGTPVASGVYLVQLRSGGKSSTGKVMLVK
ncbi:MAG: FlgD immunoglobulin-like domain containing protein, partial [Candidatus Latescibacterota bacterium]